MSVVLLTQSMNHVDPANRNGSGSVPQRLWDQALNEPAERFLSQCGKRIRAALVNESYLAAGGVAEPCREISEGIELLHAGSLIVDDIEDDSSIATRETDPAS